MAWQERHFLGYSKYEAGKSSVVKKTELSGTLRKKKKERLGVVIRKSICADRARTLTQITAPI